MDMTIANVAKWVTLNDQAVKENDISNEFILDLVSNDADCPLPAGIKFQVAGCDGAGGGTPPR
jgi:hypothetical protein